MDTSATDGPLDRASLRRLPGLFDIETLSAQYHRQSFRPHAHDEYLIGVIEGGIHAVWCRGAAHRVPQGSVVTMRPGDIHHGGAGTAAGWRQRMIYIPEAAMRLLLADSFDRPMPATLDFGAAFHARPQLAQQVTRLHAVLHGEAPALARDVALDRLLTALLVELLPGAAPSPVRPAAGIANGLDYLAAHPERDVTLAELCVVTGLGRRQTIAGIRRATGLPPHAWHLQRRIGRARQLLRQGLAPALVAADTGFADQSHMGRHFRAMVGVTPAAYARGG